MKVLQLKEIENNKYKVPFFNSPSRNIHYWKSYAKGFNYEGLKIFRNDDSIIKIKFNKKCHK